MTNEQIIDFYNEMTAKDLEYFLNLTVQRLVVPRAEDEGVCCEDVDMIRLNGIYFDVVTKPFLKKCLEKAKEDE